MSTGAYRNPHTAIAAVAALLLTGSLAAGGSLPFNSVGCPAWVGYDTPSDAAASSEAIILGVVQEQSGTVPMFSTTANVWTVRVDEWLKGAGPRRSTSSPRRQTAGLTIPPNSPTRSTKWGSCLSSSF